MSVEIRSVVVVGGGLAGFAAIRQLRELGFAGSITLIDPDPLPYDRPPLSKDYLLGVVDASVIQFESADWFEQQSVTIVRGRVASLGADRREVILEDGRAIAADSVLLAMGGQARRLSIPGGDHPAVLTLRTRVDADRLRSTFGEGTRLAIVGAGLIGAEVAAAARSANTEVILIDPVETPLIPAVGAELARRLHDMHGKHDVDVRTAAPVSLHATSDGAFEISLDDDSVVEADHVLVGIGIVPNTALAEAAGIEVDGGVIVDERQQTSTPGVFAAGDLARLRNSSGMLERREEHWEAAVTSGQRAAAAMLGLEPAKRGASWFWSDRYGVHVEGVGDMSSPGSTVLRELPAGAIAAFRIDELNALIGAAAIDGGTVIKAARRLIDQSTVVSEAELEDPSVDLRRLARRAGRGA